MIPHSHKPLQMSIDDQIETRIKDDHLQRS
jgi:hypothetical protein